MVLEQYWPDALTDAIQVCLGEIPAPYHGSSIYHTQLVTNEVFEDDHK